MDPDYQLSEAVKKQAKEREEKDKAESVERSKTILNNEFKKEIEFREKQLEQIQIKLARAAKTLHLLRYVLVTSFYNQNNVQYQQMDEEVGVTDPQNRLHPAVKKLVSENASIGLDLSRRKSARMKKQFANIVIQESEDATLKQTEEIKKEVVVPELEESNNVIEEKNSVPRNRAMVKKRIVVGNISKWMPSESLEDNSTHKWMVYVRGPKENPNIDDFVQKVIFYLHPSYQPNDVIELKGPPFHLSRRGWGEFPLRVQIFFHCALNKPIDIVHNLKLDRTYTGRQMLGNEIVTDLTIYENDRLEQNGLKHGVVSVKTEQVDELEATNFSQEDNVIDFNPLLDHNYSLKNGDKPRLEGELVDFKRKRPQESLLKTSDKRVKCDNSLFNINYDRYKVELPKNRFKNVLEALPYLLKRLPLITNLGNELDYKCTYPYVACNLLEYTSWPLEKRLSSEWSRAKVVQRILSKSNLDNKGKWITKRILAYARAHGYTQQLNSNMLKALNYQVEYLCGNSENIPLTKTPYKQTESDVDITRYEEEEPLKQSKLNLVDTRLIDPLAYVKEAAFEVGVFLKPEEIIPGVMYSASQRVLLEAVMCLAENLIRNARGVQAHQDSFSEEDCVIKAEDIREVLKSHRQEFNLILNFKKESVKY